MTDSPVAEPAHTRRSARSLAAPAAADTARQLTRAELRRLAQSGVAVQLAQVADAVEAVPAAGPVVVAELMTDAAAVAVVPAAHVSRRRTRPAETRAPIVEPAEAAPVEIEEDAVADVAALPELAPEALVLPDLEVAPEVVAIEVPHPVAAADVPVVEASVAAFAEKVAPVTLPASTRRARLRPARPVEAEPPVFELITPPDAADGPIAVAAAAVDQDAERIDAETASADKIQAAAREAIDEFEAAARLFAFTGETPVQMAALDRSAGEEPTAAAQHPSSDHVGRRRLLSFKRVATASFSVGVFGVVGLLAVGMTTPVGAVAAAQGIDAAASTTNVLAGLKATVDEDAIQAYVAPADVQVGSFERSDSYSAVSLAEIAADSGIQNFSSFFTNDPTAAIQWPFAVGVPITYGFGMRSGSMHEGADFVPGAGAPVQAIADGTVRIATESGGAFGVTVLIDHVIDGERVSSRYGHMQYDSLKVSPGETVTVGTVLGKTGDTGRSFGAHTHFEILAGGTTPIDPIPWLRSHAGG